MNLHDFHFLRPAWFLALLPLAALLYLLWRRHLSGRSWQTVVDPQLLPHLLIGSEHRRRPWGIATIALAALLAITALAGPVWDKQKQPVFRRNSALVVLLDLSQSMNATDVAPSRLQMAKFKLRDLLAQRKEGETALVVYAAVPFTVTPLTNDTDNIRRQLSSLTPELMPAQGSRADRAITLAETLLQRAGASRGNVLLVTDGIDNTPRAPLQQAVKKLLDAGYHLSVLGVGHADGAPIPLPGGGFLQDAGGAIVVAKLDEASLTHLASEGHGIYRHLSAENDRDTNALGSEFAGGPALNAAKKVNGMKSDQWREQGSWLLLPLLPLAALAFRRGYLLLLFFTLLIPLPRSAYAMGWNDLWQRPDQQAARAFAEHKPQQAAKRFQDPQWRAAAHYRAGDYQAALNDLKGQTSAAAAYNRGNALAQLGKYPEAINAYEQALKQNPRLADAKYNRDLVKKWLQQQQAKQSQQAKNGQDKKPASGKSDKQQDGTPSSADKKAGNKEAHNKSAAPKQTEKTNGTKKSDQKSQSSQSSADKSQQAKQGQTKPQQEASSNASPAKQSNEGKSPPASNTAQANKSPSADAAQQPAQSAVRASANDKDQKSQATEQWLRRIPDDPGGLWRRKFLYQYKQAYRLQQSESKPW